MILIIIKTNLLKNVLTHFIPLGCIIMKRVYSPEAIRNVELLIRSSIEYANEHPGASKNYIRQHSQELDDDVIKQHIGLYVNQFSIELGEKGREAIRFLFKKGHDANVLAEVSDTIFVDQ